MYMKRRYFALMAALFVSIAGAATVHAQTSATLALSRMGTDVLGLTWTAPAGLNTQDGFFVVFGNEATPTYNDGVGSDWWIESAGNEMWIDQWGANARVCVYDAMSDTCSAYSNTVTTNYAAPAPPPSNNPVGDIALSVPGGAAPHVTWSTNSTDPQFAQDGFQVVFGTSPNPTYGAQGTQSYGALPTEGISFLPSWGYYVRVCQHIPETDVCDNYSNEVYMGSVSQMTLTRGNPLFPHVTWTYSTDAYISFADDGIMVVFGPHANPVYGAPGTQSYGGLLTDQEVYLPLWGMHVRTCFYDVDSDTCHNYSDSVLVNPGPVLPPPPPPPSPNGSITAAVGSGSQHVTWSVDTGSDANFAQDGFQIVFGIAANPVYGAAGTQSYGATPSETEVYLPAGSYYARVCQHIPDTDVCDSYSNEVRIGAGTPPPPTPVSQLALTRTDAVANPSTIVPGGLRQLFGFSVENIGTEATVLNTLAFELQAERFDGTLLHVSTANVYIDGSLAGIASPVAHTGSQGEFALYTVAGLTTTLASGAQVEVSVELDFMHGATAALLQIELHPTLSQVTINNTQIILGSSVSSAQYLLVANGALTVTDGSHPPASNINAGTSAVNTLAEFVLTAENEGVSIDEFYFANVRNGAIQTSSNADNRVNAYYLVHDGVVIGQRAPIDGAASFSLQTPVTVAAGMSETVELRAQFNAISDERHTGTTQQISLYGVEAAGVQSGLMLSDSYVTGVAASDDIATISTAPTGNEHRVYANVPLVSLRNGVVTTPTNGLLTVANIDVTALPSNSDISWRYLVLQVDAMCGTQSDLDCVDLNLSRVYENGQLIPATFTAVGPNAVAIELANVDSISSGSTDTYQVSLHGQNFVGAPGEFVSTALAIDQVTDYSSADYASALLRTGNTFVWSDNSGIDESLLAPHWTGYTTGVLLGAIPTQFGSTPTPPLTTTTTVNQASAPLGLTATTLSEGQVQLSWTAPTDAGGGTISDYQIESRLTPTAGSYTVLSSVGSMATSYTATVSVADSAYQDFRVTAVNEAGASPNYSNSASARVISLTPHSVTGAGCPAATLSEMLSLGNTGGRVSVFMDSSVYLGANGQDRQFELIIPANISTLGARPVVFGWHGAGESANEILTQGLSGLSTDTSGIGPAIVVAPEDINVNGVIEPDLTSDWSQHEIRTTVASGVNPVTDLSLPATNPDLIFFDDMLRCLDEAFAIDHDRVYSMGFSAGAYFTNYLLMHRSDRIAAAYSGSGGLVAPGFPNGTIPFSYSSATYQQPTHLRPLLMQYGKLGGNNGSGDEVAIPDIYGHNYHIVSTSIVMADMLRADGHLVVECQGDQNHTPPGTQDMVSSLYWPFFSAHPRYVNSAPTFNGTNAFPSAFNAFLPYAGQLAGPVSQMRCDVSPKTVFIANDETQTATIARP